MEGLEEVVTEVGRGDDEDEGTAIAVQGLEVDEPVVLNADEAIAERGLVGGRKFAEEGFGEDMIGVVGEFSEGRISITPQ